MAPETLFLLWLIIGAAALAFLHALSAAVAHQTRHHQIRAKAARLRANYARRLAHEEGIIEVDEAPPEPLIAAPAEMKAAA